MQMLTPIEAVVPMRAIPSETAEQVSQLLYGELAVQVAVADGGWLPIQCAHDSYKGWVDAKMVRTVSEDEEREIRAWQPLQQQHVGMEQPDGSMMWLPLGVRVPSLQEPLPFAPADIIKAAMHFLNTPYLWGGRSSFGIDCSGLMQAAFAVCGIQLPRDASQQAQIGEPVPFTERQAGDVAFFSKPEKTNISHVGLILPSDQILHASGRVRIDFLAENGVIHSQNQQVTHSLVCIRRISRA